MLNTEIEEAISNWRERIKNNREKKKQGERVFSDQVISNKWYTDTDCRRDNRVIPRSCRMNPHTTFSYEHRLSQKFLKSM